ncbi:pyruvate dehydrogenase (acetyl-transferring) kinase, mitochondrial-like [Homalodisca vitripennis]|nr:pyruvate dehydrogenase (acetyl-transferring) kinase, mitochondrial-like [Homalodisca vitripennis]
MKALSNEANELLPIFNKTSTRFYRTTIPTGDWSNQSSCMSVRHFVTSPTNNTNRTDHKTELSRSM